MSSSIADYNDYGGFNSSPFYSGTVTGSGSGSSAPATKSGNWYDGLTDFAGSIVETAVNVGGQYLSAKAQADAAKAAAKAQERANAAVVAQRTANNANQPGIMSGVPQWAIYAGAAVVGLGVLALAVRAARR